jgi:hypothetical protein
MLISIDFGYSGAKAWVEGITITGKLRQMSLVIWTSIVSENRGCYPAANPQQ